MSSAPILGISEAEKVQGLLWRRPLPPEALEFEGSPPTASCLGVSSALSLKGWCVCPPPRHFPLPLCQPSSGREEERRRGNSGRGAGPLLHSPAGIKTQPGCGWTARRGRRAHRGAAYSPDGAVRARGVCTRETPASTALGRAGGLTGKRGETGQRCLCRRCCHRAINTVSAHTRRRLRRAPSAKSAAGGRAAGAQGQRRVQVTAVAPAVWQPPHLEAWPPATPALPLPPLPPALRAAPARGPRTLRPSLSGPARFCRAAGLGRGTT